MKRNAFFAALIALTAINLLIACDSGGSDEPITITPVVDEKPSEPSDTFVPPTGPIEPLTDELRAIYSDGKRWVVNEDPIKEKIVTYAVCGDTVFDGYNARVYSRLISDKMEYSLSRIIREEGSRVYNVYFISNQGLPEFRLSYDVDPQQGATYSSTYSTTVISRGVITLMGKERRAAKVWSGDEVWADNPYDYWVEGIGPLFGQIPNYNTMQPTGIWGIFGNLYYRLLECYDGEEKIYDHREFKHELYKPTEIFSEADK